MADDSQKSKPVKLAQTTWDYLLKFTLEHEGVVTHMYHNYPKGSSYPDVSCGVGFLLQGEAKTGDPAMKTPTQATIDRWLPYFKNQDGSAATSELFTADWEEAYKVKRATNPVNNEVKEFADKCQLRMVQDKIKPKMAEILVYQKLNLEIAGAHLANVDYWSLPAVAQVAIASIAYGFSLKKMPSFCQALNDKDFYRAASESRLSNMSDIKNNDHRLLLLDADYLTRKRADDPAAFTYLPPKLSGWSSLYSRLGDTEAE